MSDEICVIVDLPKDYDSIREPAPFIKSEVDTKKLDLSFEYIDMQQVYKYPKFRVCGKREDLKVLAELFDATPTKSYKESSILESAHRAITNKLRR